MLLVRSFLFLLLFSRLQEEATASVACETDEECINLLREGSVCREGYCTNPFYRGGCLNNVVDDWTNVRVCNSDDPPEAAELGFCKHSPFNYLELRTMGGDWETSFFSAWSEILGVPVSVESGLPDYSVDFYNRESSFNYGPWDGHLAEMTVAYKHGSDCRRVKTDNPEEYTPCFNVQTENWRTAQIVNPNLERPLDLGALGEYHFYIPKWLADINGEFAYYNTLKNRRLVAETFKTPTTWQYYCDEISNTTCELDDGIAARYPLESEGGRYFSSGVYTGHFRDTEESNCDKYPDTCAGNFVDFPCHWLSFARQQLYHLDIPLVSKGDGVSGGYSYGQLGQIWAAANATKSPVIMMYWSPESLFNSYVGTEAEFTKLLLPPPTQECIEARVPIDHLCSLDLNEATGDPAGSCDYPNFAMKKVISKGLREATFSSDIPQALWSPGYDGFVNYQITELNYGQLFNRWFERGIDKWNYDPRDAACSWVVDNLDTIKSYIPETYPRVIEDEDHTSGALFPVTIVASSLALVATASSFVTMYIKRNTKSVYYAHVFFLSFILFGLALVTLGGLVMALPPSDGSCVLSIWLVDIGQIFQLVPLVVRIYLINKLTSSGKQMQRVHIRNNILGRITTLALIAICIYLGIWTASDSPAKSVQYELTSDTNSAGDTIVSATEYCGSDSDSWMFASLAWEGVVLLPAVIIAFIARLVMEDMNDTTSLGMTLSSKFFFVILRICVFTLATDDKSDTMLYLSILLSLDTIVCLALYFLPKFVHSGDEIETEILPDLFVNTTIMFANIQGFTAWSSVREPIQVFKYLETMHETFDALAERHKVFKVETTGDLYVAATGIPEPRVDHVVAMARFASDCMRKMDTVAKNLEMMYGPDTAELELQVGIHCGPVTGGFMRGKHSRFQLFGDTMTTAALIHDTGESGKIHLSEETAKLLATSGKRRWTRERDIKIQTAAKGELQTYWLTRYRRPGTEGSDRSGTSFHGTNLSEFTDEAAATDLNSEQRWIEWNVDILLALLKKIEGRRLNQGGGGLQRDTRDASETFDMPLSEVKEIIELPEFDKDAAKRAQANQDKVDIPEDVVNQLRTFVTQIANMYCDNAFHNFAHASYVVMAVTKYMNRIITASEVDLGHDEDRRRSSSHAAIHDHTYGITSDPLTQFACVFSALIHDVDHPGVPNTQLLKENPRTAAVYHNRSIAEQKSFDMSWDIFTDKSFDGLREAICSTPAELLRFRQLVINAVMATDLGDKELKELRNGRWAKAFNDDGPEDVDFRQARNRKATIVIEHLIQAADVAHMSQHWAIYRKWNQRFFEECYLAYKSGRAEKNPADYWYEGEKGFFDFYIIPLSKKLRDCGVFGSTSDENLNYAQQNRAMWEKEGESIVAEMLATVESMNLGGEGGAPKAENGGDQQESAKN